MGCSESAYSKDLPEKLTYTRPDFDELCIKGEEALKRLNELRRDLMVTWDRLSSQLGNKQLKPEIVYLGLLVSLSILCSQDFLAINLHLSYKLPGISYFHDSLVLIPHHSHHMSDFSQCLQL